MHSGSLSPLYAYSYSSIFDSVILVATFLVSKYIGSIYTVGTCMLFSGHCFIYNAHIMKV